MNHESTGEYRQGKASSWFFQRHWNWACQGTSEYTACFAVRWVNQWTLARCARSGKAQATGAFESRIIERSTARLRAGAPSTSSRDRRPDATLLFKATS